MKILGSRVTGRGSWVLICAGLLAVLPPCHLAAQSDPRLVAAVRLAQDGQGDSARAAVKRILDATPAADPLYAEALYTSGVVAASTTEMEHQFQRLVVEHNGSPWADDALLRLAQLNFARGDLAGVARTKLKSIEGAAIIEFAKVEISMSDRKYKDAILRCRDAARQFAWVPSGAKILKRLGELESRPEVKRALETDD